MSTVEYKIRVNIFLILISAIGVYSQFLNNEVRSLVQACDNSLANPPLAVAGSCPQNPPCILQTVNEQRMNITFFCDRNCNKVTTKAWFQYLLPGINIPYTPLALLQPDACIDFKNTLKCPLKANNTYTLIKTGPIWFIPPGVYSLKISLICDGDEVKPLFCFIIRFQISFPPVIAPLQPLDFNG